MHDGRWERDNPEIEVFDVEPLQPSSSRARRTAMGAAGRRRGRVGWRPISLLAVAALAAVAVAALADRPSAAPSPSTALTAPTPVAATESPTPTTDEPSAPATLGPYWPAQIDLPLITVPAGVVHVAALQSLASPPPSGSAMGPFAYGGWSPNAPERFGVIDMGRSTITPLPLPLEKDEALAQSETDRTWLAVELVGQDPNGGATMPWRVLVARLGPDGLPVGGAGGFTQIAAGKAIGHPSADQQGYIIRAPDIKLVAGRVAWIEESASGDASVVLVRALDTRRTTTFTVKQHAVGLALSSEAVAWLESPDPAVAGFAAGNITPGVSPPAWQVMEAGRRDAVAHRVDVGSDGSRGGVPLPQIVLNGSAVVATTVDTERGATTVVQVDPAGRTVIDDGSHGRACTAAEAADGVVLLTCGWPGITVVRDGAEGPVYLGAAWTPSRGLRVITIGADEPPAAYAIRADPDWAMIFGEWSWTAVPMSALSAP